MPEAEKLRRLLRELFQFDDAAKLDFGIYRILAQVRGELDAFLGELVEGVPAKLREVGGDERGRFVEELAVYERDRRDDFDSIEQLRASKGYKERLAKVEAAVDVRELAREVFRDLYVFFKRYWDDGDFIAAPRYSKDQYAIPYDGAEVALHWANKDQYYVKSSLFFSDMSVRLGDGRLKVVLAAAVADRDNTKAADNKSRRFTLADGEDAVKVEGNDLVVQLKYGPVDEAGGGDAADGDATENEPGASEAADESGNGDAGADGKKAKTPKQEKIDAETAAEIIRRAPPEWRRWLASSDGDGQSEMYRRLRRYTKGNSADFFIHKNLRKFLRRELDFFIKNEVFDLDNIDRADLATLDGKLKRVKALRALAHDLIDWLHQVEEFQRRLFLKRKFVLRTDWAVTLDCVPKHLREEAVNNPAQREAWSRQLGLDLDTNSAEVLLNNPSALPVETRFFNEAWCASLVSGISESVDLYDQLSGTLVHGDNLQALRLLTNCFASTIRTAYIDPPYNTGQDGFLYKDAYKSSSWLSMIRDRAEAARALLDAKGVFYVSIDKNERDGLVWQLRDVYGAENRIEELIWVQDTVSNNAPAYSTNHEYVEAFARSRAAVEGTRTMFREVRPGYREVCELIAKFEGLYPSLADVEGQLRDLYRKHRDEVRAEAALSGIDAEEADRNDPWKGIYPYRFVEYRDAAGGYVTPENARATQATMWVWRPVEPSMPAGKQASSTEDPRSLNYRRYSPPHPTTGKPCKPPKRGWAFPYHPDGDRPSFDAYDADRRIAYGEDETVIPQLKYFLHEVDSVIATSVFRQYADGEPWLEALFGKKGLIQNPKPPGLIERLIRQTAGARESILDFFAGAGTTGHAVIQANRTDGGRRRMVLVEVGEHFETVLVPRLLKAAYSPHWESGRPVDPKPLSGLFKILHLESYDDTLENIELRRPDERQQQFGGQIRKDYLLRYMLNMEAKKSMLDLDRFKTPFDYKIRALVTHREESGRSWSNVEETPVDLVETFNYLLGLRVKTMQPLGRGGDMRVARYVEGLRRDTQGGWTIKVLVVWRDATKVDDAKLDEMFDTAQFTEKRDDGSRYIADFDEVYVNGDNRLPNLRRDGERWKVTLIETAFHALMFDIPDEE